MEADRIKANRIILAGPQTIFREGVAHILSQESDMKVVAKCETHAELCIAIATLKPSSMIVSLPILSGHPELLEPRKKSPIRTIAVAAPPEQIPPEIATLLHGRISRNISTADLLNCVRYVGRGRRHHQSLVDGTIALIESDHVGKCVSNRLARRELQVLGLIARAYKGKQIAECLGTKDQVVKNYTRRLFVKCGVTDRLSLAVFTSQHPLLAEAGERASALLIEARSAHHLLEFPRSSPETQSNDLFEAAAESA